MIPRMILVLCLSHPPTPYTGLETIRAFGATQRFVSEHLRRMNHNHKLYYHMIMGQTWLTVR